MHRGSSHRMVIPGLPRHYRNGEWEGLPQVRVVGCPVRMSFGNSIEGDIFYNYSLFQHEIKSTDMYWHDNWERATDEVTALRLCRVYSGVLRELTWVISAIRTVRSTSSEVRSWIYCNSNWDFQMYSHFFFIYFRCIMSHAHIPNSSVVSSMGLSRKAGWASAFDV